MAAKNLVTPPVWTPAALFPTLSRHCATLVLASNTAALGSTSWSPGRLLQRTKIICPSLPNCHSWPSTCNELHPQELTLTWYCLILRLLWHASLWINLGLPQTRVLWPGWTKGSFPPQCAAKACLSAATRTQLLSIHVYRFSSQFSESSTKDTAASDLRFC